MRWKNTACYFTCFFNQFLISIEISILDLKGSQKLWRMKILIEISILGLKGSQKFSKRIEKYLSDHIPVDIKSTI